MRDPIQIGLRSGSGNSHPSRSGWPQRARPQRFPRSHKTACIGHGYQTCGVLASGGMSTVLRAHTEQGRTCVLKVPHDSAEAIAQLENEGRILARARHRAVVDLLGYTIFADGVPALLLELIEGDSLSTLAHGRALPVDAVVDIGLNLARALSKLHDDGISHGDLKPDNIFLRALDREPVLFDFGLGCSLRDPVFLADPDFVLGTPGFLEPERIVGSGQATAAGDVYGLGAVLFFLATGRAPFVGRSADEIFERQLRDATPSIEDVSPREDVIVLSPLVQQMLARAPQRRPSAAAVLEALQTIERDRLHATEATLSDSKLLAIGDL